MNLPRLSDEKLPALPRLTYTDREVLTLMRAAAEAQRLKDEQWMREQKPVAWIDRRELEVMGKDPLVEPTVSRDSVGESDVELYAAPVPASQEERHCAYNGGTCTRRGCAVECHASRLAASVYASQGDEEVLRDAERQIRHLVEDLTVLRVEGGVNRYEAVNNLVFSNCVAAMDRLLPRLAAALAAPVTTKEAEG